MSTSLQILPHQARSFWDSSCHSWDQPQTCQNSQVRKKTQEANQIYGLSLLQSVSWLAEPARRMLASQLLTAKKPMGW
jgi:hypothetical protein